MINDSFEIEVGDTKKKAFYPQVKLKRWDNKANVSLRLDEPIKGSKPTVKGMTGRWVKESVETQFYGLENGFEFSVLLNKKPDKNYLTFTVETKYCDIYPQPELTKAEKAQGLGRPVDVINSLALYSPFRNGRYKAGKIGHIYRPFVLDSNGRREWCDLTYEGNGEIRLWIPSHVVNAGIYPLWIDPSFGYTTAGSSTDDSFENRIYAVQGTTESVAGTVSEVVCYCLSNNSLQFRAGVYDEATGAPDDVVGTSNTGVTAPAVAAWTSNNNPTGSVSGATNYWAAVWGEGGTGILRIYYDSTTWNSAYNNETYSTGSWPDPWSNDGSWSDRGYSIYCTYTVTTTPRRCELEIQATQVSDLSTDNTKFPVLLDKDNTPISDIWSYAKSNGDDLRIYRDNTDTDRCPLDVAVFNSVTERFQLWTSDIQISHSADTSFYIRYGESGWSLPADNAEYGRDDVWGGYTGGHGEYEAVYHMDEASGNITDFTGNGNTGTSAGSPDYEEDGKVGHCIKFNADGERFGCGDLDVSTDITVVCWANTDTNTQGSGSTRNGHLVSKWESYIMRLFNVGASGFTGFEFAIYDSSTLYNIDVGTYPTLNTWYMVHGTYDGSTVRLYTDGSEQGSGTSHTGDIDTNNNTLYLGDYQNSDFYYKGWLDEVRIKNTASSSNWISTEYNSQNAPGTFIVEGTPANAATADTDLLDGKVVILSDDSDLLDGKVVVLNKDTDLLDGKVVVLTADTDLLDGKVVISDEDTDLLDGKVVVLNKDTDLLDGKVVVLNVDTDLLDGKVVVVSDDSDLFDGKITILDVDTDLLDGKVEITTGTDDTDLLDGKVQILDVDTDLLDGKVIIAALDTDVFDGKIVILDDTVSLLDGKLQILDDTTVVYDGKVVILDVDTDLFDGKVAIRNSDTDLLDGKVTISDVTTDLLDGKVSVLNDDTDLLDGKLLIVLADTDLFDGKIAILDDDTDKFDGKIVVSGGAEPPSGTRYVINLETGGTRYELSIETSGTRCEGGGKA